MCEAVLKFASYASNLLYLGLVPSSTTARKKKNDNLSCKFAKNRSFSRRRSLRAERACERNIKTAGGAVEKCSLDQIKKDYSPINHLNLNRHIVNEEPKRVEKP